MSARVDPAPESEPEPEPEPDCSRCGTRAQPDDVFCAECGHRLANDTNIIEPVPEPAIETAATATAPIEPTRVRPVEQSTERGERFVLQFSTGESYTVLGSGLAGRNPRAEPGEVVDHLVTIVDPGRSVSKTHLEFGQVDGEFWVSDRHSGNGTVIHEPGAEPRACTPGRRYRVERGTRIDLGEQYVLVI